MMLSFLCYPHFDRIVVQGAVREDEPLATGAYWWHLPAMTVPCERYPRLPDLLEACGESLFDVGGALRDYSRVGGTPRPPA